MADGGASKTVLFVFNIIYAFVGLVIACTAIWFAVEVKEFTNLRNIYHYQLDYNIYGPQGIPWLFFVAALLVLFNSACGFSGAMKGKRGLVVTYAVCVGLLTLVLVAVAVIALVVVDNKPTDDFFKDTIWDAFTTTKENPQVADAFGYIEKKFHCCGVESPRDYKNWKNEFPTSCCDVHHRGWLLDDYPLDCQFTDKLANERHGCATVASEYAKIAIKAMSAGSLLAALIGVICLFVALNLSKNLKRHQPRMVPQDITESKKVLL